MSTDRVAVIGGGVIGLAVARRLALSGLKVRVHRTEQLGSSWVAGGMLAPHSEAWPGEERLLQIGLESLAMWHDSSPAGFLADLPDDVVTAHESLVVAVDRADAADLRTVGEWLAAHGEPLGVEWARPVADLAEAGDADALVIANGVDAPTLWPGLPIRPVKGEVLRLRWRPGCMPVPRRVIRARVHGRQVYLVPRVEGVVVGATQYEHGRDTAPAVTGVRELLDDACTVMPALGEYELAEVAAGLRPMTSDNVPLVGRLDDRVLVAAGHGRNGFLLAPWTAERIVTELNVKVPSR